MVSAETQFWTRVAKDFDIEIITPFLLTLADRSQICVPVLVKNFGARNGMLVSRDYEILRPHKKEILELGYGYSANLGDPATYDRNTFMDVLKDWKWTGTADKMPSWLP